MGGSKKARHLTCIFETAHHVWASETDAQEFLNTPHPMLENRTPLEVSLTRVGAHRVEKLLMNIYYGLLV